MNELDGCSVGRSVLPDTHVHVGISHERRPCYCMRASDHSATTAQAYIIRLFEDKAPKLVRLS